MVVRFFGVGRAAAYLQLSHQFAHSVQGQAGEFFRQEALHEPEAEPAVRLKPNAPNRLALGRPVVPRAAVGEPRVEARSAHAEHAGHHLHREFGLLRQHQPVALVYAWLLAKKAAAFFQEGVLHLELAAAVLHPLVHRLGIQPQFGAAFRYRPARRDDVVGGLVPELVGVLGGWVGHGVCPSGRRRHVF